MKEPVKPYPPYKSDFEAKIERKYIYSFRESLREDEDDYDDDEEEVESWSQQNIDSINLEWLVSQIPDGIGANQIKIDFGYNASSMAFEDHYVRFYYEVNVPAKNAEYKAAQNKYDEDLAQYKKDMVEYKTVCHAERVKYLEGELARLKNE